MTCVVTKTRSKERVRSLAQGFLFLSLGLSFGARAQRFEELESTRTVDATRKYPDVVPAIQSIQGLGANPAYLGISAGELEKKVGAFNKAQKQLSTTTLSTDLFEMLVSFFAQGDPNLARQLRSSPVFKRAVAVLLNPSARPEEINVALGQLTDLSGMNRRDMLAGLTALADGGGEKMAGANKSALLGNLSAARIANAQNVSKNDLAMADFTSPEVAQLGEGRVIPSANTRYQPGAAQTGFDPGSSAVETESETPDNGSPALPTRNPAGRGTLPTMNTGNRYTSDLAKGAGFKHSEPMSADVPTGGSRYTAAAAAPTKVVESASKPGATDPMLSMLGGDFADPHRYESSGGGIGNVGVGSGEGKGGGGKRASGRSRIADDFIKCRGKLGEKADEMTLAEICVHSNECRETKECECYNSFTKEMSGKSPAAPTKEKQKQVVQHCSVFEKTMCSGDVDAIENGELQDVLRQRVGTFERKISEESGTAYKTKATALLGELNEWLDSSPTITSSGKKYGPAERLSLIMNVLAGTNRGLCLLANGRAELPFGPNSKKEPFEFYEVAQTEIEKGGVHQTACAKLDSSNLSSGWKSQSDRLQVMAFFHVLDQMRELHEETGKKASLTGQPGDSSFEKKVLDSNGFEDKKNGPKGSNALAKALSTQCGRNSWLSVLESAEQELRPLALKCGYNESQSKEATFPGKSEASLHLILCTGKPTKETLIAQPQGVVTNASDFDKSFLSGGPVPANFGANSEPIGSGFLKDYLKLTRTPSEKSPECNAVLTKYYNINKLLTRRFNPTLQSDISKSETCVDYLKNGSSGQHNGR
jgi:hypothetical protein